MKFPNIDFDAINNMLNNMSEEEKQDMMNMAQNMMNNMDLENTVPPVQQEPEDEEDFYTLLNIDPKEYESLPNNCLDPIEAAVDLEEFYDKDSQADYSASVLFYAKAALIILQKEMAPLFTNILKKEQFTSFSTLPMYYEYLMDDTNIQTLADATETSIDQWVKIRSLIQMLVTLLSKAEYNTISYEELQTLKDQLFTQKGFLSFLTSSKKPQ